jgi:hypothetical protein
MDQHSEIQYQHEARFANEQQNTPNIKACPQKIPIVILRAIQHSAQLIVSTINNSRTSTDVTSNFCSASPRLSN